MLFNKKAGTYGVIITIAILLLSTGVIASMVQKVPKTSEKLTEGLACRTFLGIKKFGQDMTGGTLNPVVKNCQTINVSIPGDHKPTNKFQMENLFAQKIKKAWHIVHEGTVEDLWGDKFFGSIVGNDFKCVILYAIDYEDKKASLGLTANMSEFQDFLMTAPAFTDETKEWTYLDYIQSYGAPSHIFLVPKQIYDVKSNKTLVNDTRHFLSPGQTYGIALAGISRGAISTSKFNRVIGGTILGQVAALAGLTVLTVASGGVALAVVAAGGVLGGLAGNALGESSEDPSVNTVNADENTFMLFGDLTSLKNAGCVTITPVD